MKKILLLSFMLLFTVAFSAWAQDRTVSGSIKDQTGTGLPGVNVILKGTTNGTTTDIDGNYRLSIPSDGGILQFSFIGLKTQEIEIGARSVVDVTMAEDVETLSEVVVTAQGIVREKESLGYAVSTVDSEDLQRKPNSDIAQLMAGKVPGVNITSTSGIAGGGMNIIIRGYSSINGTNQPLFIVDGIPFNSNTNTQSNFTGGSLNSSSRFLDLDPNNIANIQVLKGLSATVLYGEQGRNGVVLITTKSGNAASVQDDFSVDLTQGLFFTEIASLPDYQDTYGNGFHQFPAFFFSNWGDRIDNVGNVAHPYSNFSDPALLAAFPEFQDAEYEYRAYENAEKFFRTGVTSQTSLSVSGRAGNTSISSTVSYVNEEGFIPDNSLEKVNASLGINSKITDKLSIASTFSLALTETTAPPLGASTGSSASGDGSAFYANVLYTPRTVDLNGLPFEHPVTGESVYYRGGNDIPNPNWLIKYTDANNDITRINGKFQLKYDILDNLSITYRGGYDTYYEFQEYIVNKGIGSGPANADLDLGIYRTTHIRNAIWDHTALLNWNYDISDDLNLSTLVGANARLDRFDRDGLESIGQNAFGFIEHGNFTTTSSRNSFSNTDIQRREDENLYAVYANIALDYKSWLFLNLQGRNDWSSTVEEDNQQIFYPSVSLSFIPTRAISGLESKMFNYAKLRVGYGTSAGFPDPYNTRNTLASTARGFVGADGTVYSTNATSNRLGNPNLGAERLTELEFGVELKAFNNRFGLDFSYFDKQSEDLITDADLDPSTGYDVTNINAGKITTTGFEIAATGTPLVLGDFKWEVGLNYYAYESVVDELAPEFGLDFIQISGFTDFAGNAMIPGEVYGALYGTLVETTDDGRRIVNDNGSYIIADEPGIIGDPNPDFNIGATSTFTWKGISLGMLWDYRHGGDVFSITAAALVGRGLTTDTDFDREAPVILPGVRQVGTAEDGSPIYAENDVQITTTDAWFNNLGFGATEDRVFDGTTIRLRELSLGYSLPKSLLDKLPVNGVSISFVGQNLWFKAVNFPEGVNFDTDVLGTGVGNALGLDFLTGPSSRRFGGTLKITF